MMDLLILPTKFGLLLLRIYKIHAIRYKAIRGLDSTLSKDDAFINQGSTYHDIMEYNLLGSHSGSSTAVIDQDAIPSHIIRIN